MPKKKYEYIISYRGTLTVKADNDEEAMERAGEILPTDCEEVIIEEFFPLSKE